MGTIKVILAGMAAGLTATVVLSFLMLTKAWLPQLDPVVMLDGVARAVFSDLEAPVPLAGWLWHFIIGTLWWGPLFALMAPILPGKRMWQKGVSFGFGAALLIMLMIVPLAGAGYFDMALSPLQPLITLLLHLIYGAVLGTVFQRLAAGPALQ
ncbi:MAG: hypothetical protein QNJ87_09570 [Gammaproteobacteria bacterium]|nr:hypothetical protein [Gammaproteobacteria bacterium]MDJ0872009.1 hypothetical protein [Gammaproteobacteria bacterium]MDJ0890817.1 hypothetical protein [Gammaproteobacteria bacterium]